MKKFFIHILKALFLLLLPSTAFTQPADFVKDCDNTTGVFSFAFGYLDINGEPAVPGEDFLGAFDSDGFCIGVAEIQVFPPGGGCLEGLGYNLSVAGFNSAPGIPCPAGYGANNGEEITILVFDGSTGNYYDLPGTYIFNSSTPFFQTSADFGCDIQDANEIVLPVSLQRFRGFVAEDKFVQLEWITSFEEDFSHFEVERSTDGVSWQTIGSIPGVLNPGDSNAYDFLDLSPPGRNNYYRLRIVDEDESQKMSGVVIVELAESGQPSISVFPNPLNAQLTHLGLRLKGDWVEDKPIQASLFDARGRLLVNFDQLVLGTNSLALPEGIPAGLYLIQTIQGATSIRQKLIIH